MSDIYKEALAEAAKLREIAEQDARNSIIEQISPYIKKMIMKEASSLFSEQDDIGAVPPEQSFPPGATPEDAMTTTEPGAAPESTVPEELPVSPTEGEDVVNVPMQSLGDGKVVIDFKDLFADQDKMSDIINPADAMAPSDTEMATAPVPPVDPMAAPSPTVDAAVAPAPAMPDMAPPMPAAAPGAPPAAGPPPAPETAGAAAEEEEPVPAPITEVKNVKQLERQLAEMAVRIDRLYQNKISTSMSEVYRNKLFSLLEQLDKLAANKAITPKQTRLNENRLEFLFLHLKEANSNNSYNKKKDGNKNMTTLKEFAAKLFESSEDEERLEQDSVSSGKTGVPTHRKATKHAQSVDGVQADLFEGDSQTIETRHAAAGSVDADKIDDEAKEQAWEEALMEEIQAALRDELDAHEERPEEVPASVKDSGYFDIDAGALKEAVRKLRKENAMKKLMEQEDMEDMGDEGGMDEDLQLTVDLPDEVESELDADDLEVELALTGDDDMEDMDSEEEEMVDLDMSDDEEDMDSEEEDMLLTDEEDDDMEEMAMPSKSMQETRRVRKALLEARKARKLAEAKHVEAKTLKRDLTETNLFLSKLVYLNKFLVREDLSRKVKQQIVEHLDRANTIAEAKAIYQKINRKLDEAAAAHTAPVVGSASKPTTAGSARLNESVSRTASPYGSEPVIGTFDKWQILANIKKRQD